jgi:hydroxymethylglutaryl-CoA lyase
MQHPPNTGTLDVLISEVGPRDGLQSVQGTMPTDDKKRWIDALVAAGLREIEVASFVPARLLPQMADAAEVRAIVQLRNDIAPHVGIATAFGCTLQGEVPEDDVVRLAAAVIEAGADESGLSDTTGMANPAQVRRLFNRVRAEIGEHTGAAHLHNTRGLGLANCLAAFDVGVRTFDSSLGGLGGCPYSPGASGNVVTEDLVFMFEAMGLRTGIDLTRLMAAREPLRAGLPGEALYGMTPEAGLPKGWVQGATHV